LGDGIARAVELARAAAGKTGDGGVTGAPLKDARGRSLASILLLSDGAQTRGLLSPGQGAARAQQAGIPVYTIALGTDGGTILAGPPGQEQVIPVPPDRETLGAIAEYTGAESFDAESAGALEKVYAGLGSRVGREDRPREVTAAFVAAGALLLARAAGLSLLSAPPLTSPAPARPSSQRASRILARCCSRCGTSRCDSAASWLWPASPSTSTGASCRA